MSRKMQIVLVLLTVLSVLAMTLGGCGPQATEAPPAEEEAAPEEEEATADWAHQPMDETATVVLSVESGAQEKTLQSFHDEILEKLNIDLQVVAHPFSEQYEIQYLDLSSGAGQYDILSYWPMYTADFFEFLEPFGNIRPGGDDMVAEDLEYDGVLDGYAWCYKYKDRFYSAQYDGDVKLLHYRHDLANDEDLKAAFADEYGYEWDIEDLTWDQYLDVGAFFQNEEQDFYGTAEIAGFLAGFGFKDRFWGYGGHLFDYETMDALGCETPTGESCFDACVASVQNGIDTFNEISPPEAHSFEFEDARNQIIVHGRVMFHLLWPDAWKWANDPNLGNPDEAVCKVAVAQLPGFEMDGDVYHRPNENGGRVLAINAASEVKEAAYKVIVFMQNPERTSQLVYNNDTWLDPWRVEHVQPEAASHLCEGCEWNCQLYMDIIEESTKNGYPALQIPGAGKYHEVMERWAKKAWANQVTAQETCEGIQQEFDQITDEIGRESQIEEYQRYVDNVLKPKELWP